MIRQIVLAGVLSGAALGLAACGGGGARTETTVTSVTTGQELTDLQKALESGAITQEEFDKKKAEILRK